ncbi:MAG TPA: alpha/beta hydrolase [Bryobacteraceae bacterium]|jgi:pimeloyl-ACP methyl ester carboxylesterase|nr:alpha/beta hydrolase [Bryobacteraceae bacterium]
MGLVQFRATHWVHRVAVTIAFTAAALALCGAISERVGESRDAQRFPRIGCLVQAAGLTFNINCYGSGSPTVVLESGLGLSSIGWVRIQPEIAKFARVCSYDRAGYGWSDRAQGRRTSLQLAKELKALLESAGEKGPYILVGPSFGGFIIRVYTGLYPADVAGLVFLDASHEDQQHRIDEIVPAAKEPRMKAEDNERRREQRELMLSKFTVPLGIERLEATFHPDKPEPAFGLSAHLIEEMNYLDQQAKTREVVLAESTAMPESGKMAKYSGNLGDRPTIVLTGGKMEFTPDPLFTDVVQEKLRNLWINVLQADEARLSTRGRQIVLKDSGHVIQLERPDAVIDAVRDVWSEVRASKPIAMHPNSGR